MVVFNWKHSRRRFLQALSAMAAVSTSRQIAAARTIPSRPIPSSGEAVPIIGLGTARTFNIDATSERVIELRGVLQRFHEYGGRMIDSSPMYGHSEAITGMMARQLDLTDDLFFATKVWTEGKTEGSRQMDTSAKHFQTDVIDLMQVHNLVDLQTQLQSIRARKAEGRVRYVGVTHYRDDIHDELANLLMREPLDFVQVNYSVASRHAEERLLPTARDQGVAVIINQAFERGRLFGQIGQAPLPAWVRDLGIASWAQYMLKFVLSHPAVTVVIPAADKIEYIDDNMPAAFGPMPDAAMRQRMAVHLQSII